MKNNKFRLLTLVIMFGVISCDTDYIDDPDNPVVAPSTQLLNSAAFDLAYELNDQWVAGRGTLGMAQYWNQTFYTEENRYALRNTMVDDMWEWPYRILTDLKEIISLNEDPETSVLMSAYGSNNNQIQVSRILMAFTFSKLVDTFGDVPYWSYGGRDNADFQALQLEAGINSPVYVDDQVIYEDMLNELLEAANSMDTSSIAFTEGDNIYNGDSSAWVKFAHSLRLRLAAHIAYSNPALAAQTYSESNDEAFTSNSDNATYTFGTDDITGGPWHIAFTVDARRDFGPSLSFTELLYNRVGPFNGVGSDDPRVDAYFDTRLDTEEVVGLPYGFGNASVRAIDDEGIPDATILQPDYTQPLLTYAEVEFIRSEFEGWSQANYESGVAASMEYWGISAEDATAYVAALPAASEETVLTQKYIALYMDGLEGWTEYRRSGFPTTLTVPGDTYDDGEEILTFTTLVPGLDIIPTRVTYPNNEQLLNNSNWDAARSKLSDGDVMYSKIFWDVE
ncbi:SusD/RagB family nutrient-binding outer membrane lipoprotein [Pricia sp. S334]|uniref:SusD/RagB family nutrient-binding outer membrane lipoprotein n=1 Tax=Pricia mediterranea TaxID=3076079 RepID=A0ABU3L419_9FLAO|nr:SusD/RagB family nutrient-binding outer membrane lipoprotein [Pricia sp. S334]MDT7827949.1 SusD/RagB family nutrient-binding outer membrane lipoprotein [Pricia sp. S334]